MCAWCWAYRPVSDRLFAELPSAVRLKRVLGGLAPDSDMPMAYDMQEKISGIWHRIQDLLGTEFNHAFWTDCEPRRSTYPACRAVIAAEKQGQHEQMIDAIQRAYYLRAMNPSDTETLETIADELELDSARFVMDLRSDETNQALQAQVDFTQRSGVAGFPSLALMVGDRLHPVTQDYQTHETTLQQIAALTAD